MEFQTFHSLCPSYLGTLTGSACLYVSRTNPSFILRADRVTSRCWAPSFILKESFSFVRLGVPLNSVLPLQITFISSSHDSLCKDRLLPEQVRHLRFVGSTPEPTVNKWQCGWAQSPGIFIANLVIIYSLALQGFLFSCVVFYIKSRSRFTVNLGDIKITVPYLMLYLPGSWDCYEQHFNLGNLCSNI